MALFLASMVFGAGISVTNSTATRLVSVSLTPPPDSRWVKLSQDSEFRESTNGIVIQLASVHPNLDQAVVHVTYPNGKPGGRGLPGGLADGRRSVKILAVLARLSDGGEVPAYATPAWLERIMFSDTEGVDARGVWNNVKAYWEQNTYGRVQIRGDVYPEWVTLKSSSNYVDLPSTFDTPTTLTLDAIAAIKQQSPAFFADEDYDFVVLLFPGDLAAVYNSFYEQSGSIWADPNGIFGGYLIMDIPVEWTSKYFGAIRGEKATVLDSQRVRTRFPVRHVSGVFLASDADRTFDYMTNHDWFFQDSVIRLDRPLPSANSEVMVDYSTDYFTETRKPIDALRVDTSYSILRVLGVWLAADTNRSGTNFFIGGNYSYRDNHIMLGTALPGDDAFVVIDYETGVHFRFWSEESPHFSAENVGGWYGTFLHEMAHGLAPHITFTDSHYLGDLYQGADEIFSYGLMSGGNHLQWPLDPASFPHFESPAHLDAYTKYSLGLLLPYEVRYGENETNLTIYAVEEYPYTSRTKLVKVPLQPPGVRGYRRAEGYDYAGEEYLLLELRRRGEVPGIYNFDRGIPHEGLLIYHVIDRDPHTIGAWWHNMIKIIDATPPTPGDWFWNTNFSPRNIAQDSLYYTPAPFGRDSGVMRYVHGSSWQEIGNSNVSFRVEGFGQQTIYARFRNFGTNESPVYSAVVTFTPEGGDANTNDIADSWEQQYFGSSSIPDVGNGDPDNDGLTNLEEFVAGTNPTNAMSRLTVALERNNGLNLVFATVRDRSYVVETARSAMRPRWCPFYSGSSLPGNNDVMVISDYFPKTSERFYRVRLAPE